jgi:hypothetical protein
MELETTTCEIRTVGRAWHHNQSQVCLAVWGSVTLHLGPDLQQMLTQSKLSPPAYRHLTVFLLCHNTNLGATV